MRRKGRVQPRVLAESLDARFQLADRGRLVVAILDRVEAADRVDDREEGGVHSERCAAAFRVEVRLRAEPAPELEEQPRLADPGLAHQEHDAPAPAARARERLGELRELALAASQRREPRVGERGEPPGALPFSQHLVGAWRARETPFSESSPRSRVSKNPATSRAVASETITAPGRRGSLQAGGEVGGIADRGVVHAQVVSDASDHDDARVDADPHLEIDVLRVRELLAQRRERTLDSERRQHRAPRRVLERDRSAEDRHDSVAGELVHRALVAVYLVEQQREAAVHQRVHLVDAQASGDPG